MNIKFIDSLCFIPMKLAAFPKTFGLTELQKGYFPHFFNRAENQNYVGPLPHANFYDPDGMSSDDREKFYTTIRKVLYNHMTMQDLKQRTLEKIQFLKDHGYNVVEIWTCDIERQLATEPEMKDFFDNFEISEPLEPRHAFFGGRTNATRLYYDVQPEEKIRYVDFCSLYPWYVSF